MLEKMSQSSENVLGYKAVDKITRDDYVVLIADVEALIQKVGAIGLLLDLEEFHGEEFKAWWADLKFGHDYRKKIAKMAIVGDKKWQKWLTAIVDPFYAREAEYSPIAEREAAWE